MLRADTAVNIKRGPVPCFMWCLEPSKEGDHWDVRSGPERGRRTFQGQGTEASGAGVTLHALTLCLSLYHTPNSFRRFLLLFIFSHVAMEVLKILVVKPSSHDFDFVVTPGSAIDTTRVYYHSLIFLSTTSVILFLLSNFKTIWNVFGYFIFSDEFTIIFLSKSSIIQWIPQLNQRTFLKQKYISCHT